MANAMIVSPTRGKFYFDAVFKTDHKRELTLTSHPIQSGAAISDHSYFEPDTIAMDVGYSDVMASTGEMNHSVNAFTQLCAIMDDREPLTVVTRFKVYSDMIITSLEVPDEYAAMYGMKASIGFTKVDIVEAQIVTVQSKTSSGKAPPKKDETIEVSEESVPAVDNRSLLLQISQDLVGYDPTKESWHTSARTTNADGSGKTDGSGQGVDAVSGAAPRVDR